MGKREEREMTNSREGERDAF